MDSESAKNPKAKGGRKPKPLSERAIYKVGGFWLTKAEKDIYDRNFKASGLGNQTEFLRKILFRDPIRIYYQDTYSEKIYTELLKIEREMQSVTRNNSQVVKCIHSLSLREDLYFSLEKLGELTQTMNTLFQKMLPLFKPFEPDIGITSTTLMEEKQDQKLL